MADDRPAESEVEALARLQRELEDLRSTVMVRVGRSPTGTIAPVLLTTAPTDTLLLQGQTVNRDAYPVLWKWASDNGLVGVAGLFGTGNGATTFVLPDFRGRVPIGAGTLGTDTYAVGALIGEARHTLTTAEMPSHQHTGRTGAVGDHDHLIGSGGQHGGHFPGSSFMALAGPDLGLAAWNSGGAGNGNHNHPMNWNGGHDHGFTTSAAGSGAAHENRQPSVAVNWMIWV